MTNLGERRGKGLWPQCDDGTAVASSFFAFLIPLHFPPQPGPGKDPVAVGRAGGDAQEGGPPAARQAAEEPTLPQAGSEGGRRGVRGGERPRGGVKGRQVLVRLGHGSEVGREALTRPPPAVLPALLAAGGFDEDPAHGRGRGGEEMAAAVPALGLPSLTPG